MDSRTIIIVVVLVIAFFAYEQFVVTPLSERRPAATSTEKARRAAATPAGTEVKNSPGAASSQATASSRPSAQTAPATGSEVSAQAASPASAPSEAAASPPGEIPKGPIASLEPVVPGGKARTIEVDTNYYDAVFTTRGARLKSLTLDKFRETAAKDSPPYQMVTRAPGGALPFGVIASAAGKLADDGALNYTTSAPARIKLKPGQSVTIDFSARSKSGLQIDKSFTLRDSSYVFDVAARLIGGTGLDGLGLTISQPLGKKTGYDNVPELQYLLTGKAGTETEKKLKKGIKPVEGELGYVGYGDLYFLLAYIPRVPQVGSLDMDFANGEAGARMMFAGVTALSGQVYAGPKLLKNLQVADPKLRKAIDFGWSGFIALPFLRALELFHLFSPNWGVDILLLTLVLRLLMVPVSIRGQRVSMKMQRLQPQVEKIREKFKDDSERLNREMMDLYKRNHVSPLGGCLPMLIQFPVFWGLFEALLNAVQLRHAPFAWWITDLSAPDCLKLSWMPKLPFIDCHGLPVLVILMGISSYFQTRLSPMSPDPNQQKTMAIMPLVFTVFFIYMPSGLTLYYFASNILGIIQQLFLNWEFEQSNAKTNQSANAA